MTTIMIRVYSLQFFFRRSELKLHARDTAENQNDIFVQPCLEALGQGTLNDVHVVIWLSPHREFETFRADFIPHDVRHLDTSVFWTTHYSMT